ncbi:MAG TPA: serine/threonine protein kinase, partial [Myxococcales bacterium]|nr:serine/threonine protein kinase [Myxococcales bacterium]
MQQGDILAGRYRLIARLGEGGMGEVWRAEQVALGREVAVKLVRGELNEPHARERFRREAELAAKVQHRNVVDILDFGTVEAGDTDDSERGEDTQYLVMPLLEGETLHARLHRTRPALRDLLVWMRGLLSGLAAIHDRGIVHRDL